MSVIDLLALRRIYKFNVVLQVVMQEGETGLFEKSLTFLFLRDETMSLTWFRAIPSRMHVFDGVYLCLCTILLLERQFCRHYTTAYDESREFPLIQELK